MINILIATTIAVASVQAVSPGQGTTAPRPAPQPGAAPQEAARPTTETTAAGTDIKDLEAMIFSCPRAGLNAAAREAAQDAAAAKSQGTYQFSFFRIVNESHHASYEVHFKSNYAGEPDLNYCVLVYCQQGWDPKSSKTEVTKMASAARPAKGMAHHASCEVPPPPPAPRKGKK
jgi:hypothetical protein